MALHDEILREIAAGRVPRRFKTRDLKRIPATVTGRYIVGDGEYSEKAINTIPRNHSVRPEGADPGDYVQKGRKPAFFWFGKGEYELILTDEHYLEDINPEDEFDMEGEEETLIRGNTHGVSPRPLPIKVDSSLVLRITEREPETGPVALIVNYIADQPFQAYYRREPLKSLKHGWGARLAAYFWPTPDKDWHSACAVVGGLSSRVQRTVERLKAWPDDTAAAVELMEAFKAICLWGGVKLPKCEPSALAAEVMCALQALADGNEPPATCRLNSAWTKLYAFALPRRCVIYDSRVAAALTSILDPAIRLIREWPEWPAYSNLGTIPGRGGSRPRNLCSVWPNGYREWASQIAANLVCQGVVEELNRQPRRSDYQKLDDRSPWTLREVEAVLFMEGY